MTDPRSEDEEPDRDKKTPRTTDSFNVYANAAQEMADKLEAFAYLKRKQMLAQAHAQADEAERLEARLRELALRFAAWPGMNAEAVAFERYTLNLPGDLMTIRDLAKVLLAR